MSGIKPHADFNQRQRLSDLGILAFRHDGISIHYRVVDLCVRAFLDQVLPRFDEVFMLGTKAAR